VVSGSNDTITVTREVWARQPTASRQMSALPPKADPVLSHQRRGRDFVAPGIGTP